MSHRHRNGILLQAILILFLVMPVRAASGEKGALLNIIGPNGGERWVKGSIQPITWKSEGITGPVKLVLIKGNTVYGDIVLNQPASGSYKWVVGDCPASGRSAEPAREYRIRVVDAKNSAIRDDSNGSFRIIAADKS